MLLTEQTRDIYLTAKKNLTCPVNQLEPSSLAERVGGAGDATRGAASIDQLSLLRTSMRADVEIYTQPYDQSLSEDDVDFLQAYNIDLGRPPWREALARRGAHSEPPPPGATAVRHGTLRRGHLRVGAEGKLDRVVERERPTLGADGLVLVAERLACRREVPLEQRVPEGNRDGQAERLPEGCDRLGENDRAPRIVRAGLRHGYALDLEARLDDIAEPEGGTQALAVARSGFSGSPRMSAQSAR